MDDYDIGQHPDLKDPDWQRHAVKEAWTDLRKQRRRARRSKRLAWTAVSLVVVSGAVFGLVQWGKSTSAHYDGSAPQAAGIQTTAPSVLPDVARVDLNRPFDGTPAETWSESVDTLTAPAVTPIGNFSAQQVQAAIDQVKEVIRVSMLDRRTLEGHETEPFVALFAPDVRGHLRSVLADRSKPDFSAYVILVADGFRLLPANPRITGNLTVRQGDNKNELVIHVSSVTGYAFDPGSHSPILSPGEIDAFYRVEGDYRMLINQSFKANNGLWPGESQGSFYSMSCRASKDGYVAPAYSNSSIPTTRITDEAAQFDVNQPLPLDGNCPE